MSNIKDQVVSISGVDVAQGAFAVLDSTQDFPPAKQIVSAALTFLMWCHRYNLDPREMLTIANYVFREGLTKNNPHIYALKHYMKIDIQDPSSFNF